jgi:hypothetical protein
MFEDVEAPATTLWGDTWALTIIRPLLLARNRAMERLGPRRDLSDTVAEEQHVAWHGRHNLETSRHGHRLVKPADSAH